MINNVQIFFLKKSKVMQAHFHTCDLLAAYRDFYYDVLEREKNHGIENETCKLK